MPEGGTGWNGRDAGKKRTGARRGCRRRSGKGDLRVEGECGMTEILSEILGLARVHTVLLVLILFAALYLCWEDWRW